MKNMLVRALVLMLLSVSFVSAQQISPSTCIQQVPAMFTCYAPGAVVSAKGVDVEGGFETSRPGLNGRSIPTTLDDVREGRATAVSLAGNPNNYGKYYNLGTVQYQSVKGGVYTLENVVGYVHDTGCAFLAPSENGSCCSKFNTCDSVYRHFDIAHGDFRGSFPQGALEDAQSGPACGKIEKTICQIGGPLTTPPKVTYVGPGKNERTMMSLANLQTGGLGTGNGQGVTSAPGITTSPATGGQPGRQGQVGSTPNQTLSSSALGQMNGQTGFVGNVQLSSLSPYGFIFTQSKSVERGRPMVVSWGVVGAVTSCVVSMRLDSGESQTIGTGSSGTRVIATSPISLSGNRVFVLSCAGTSPFEKRTTLTVR